MATLQEKTAIVTGSSRGIGRAIALRLARDGMDVVVVDLRADSAATVAGEVQTLGRRALAFQGDVARAEDRSRMFEAALATFGRLDALVNNAATMRVALPLDVTEEHWDVMMDVNAKAVYFCCQLALEHMLR